MTCGFRRKPYVSGTDTFNVFSDSLYPGAFLKHWGTPQTQIRLTVRLLMWPLWTTGPDAHWHNGSWWSMTCFAFFNQVELGSHEALCDCRRCRLWKKSFEPDLLSGIMVLDRWAQRNKVPRVVAVVGGYSAERAGIAIAYRSFSTGVVDAKDLIAAFYAIRHAGRGRMCFWSVRPLS